MIAPFQLRPEKKDTVLCPLSRHSNSDRKKKIQSSGHHSLRRSNCHCCAVPITTGKKKIQSSICCYAVPNTTGKKRNKCGIFLFEKKNFTIYHSCTIPIVVWKSFIAPFQLPLLRHFNYDQKKRCSRLSVVMPFQIRPEKKETNVEKKYL